MDNKFQDICPEKPYIIPRRLNQDIVESWFSHQRGLCGDSREPTVSQSGQNNTKLLSLTRARGDISKNSYGTASIDEIAEDRQHLSKNKNRRHFTWPVNL
jgi:hypothetical protein